MIQQQKKGGGLLSTALSLIKDGPMTFFRGTGPMMMREGIYAGGFLGVMPVTREMIRKHFPDSLGKTEDSAACGFASHPPDTIKTCMQGDIERVTYGGFVETGRTIVATKGAPFLWAGFPWRLFRQFTALMLFDKIASEAAADDVSPRVQKVSRVLLGVSLSVARRHPSLRVRVRHGHGLLWDRLGWDRLGPQQPDSRQGAALGRPETTPYAAACRGSAARHFVTVVHTSHRYSSRAEGARSLAPGANTCWCGLPQVSVVGVRYFHGAKGWVRGSLLGALARGFFCLPRSLVVLVGVRRVVWVGRAPGAYVAPEHRYICAHTPPVSHIRFARFLALRLGSRPLSSEAVVARVCHEDPGQPDGAILLVLA
eukprot:CAMPEP_0181172908 /NCGR_PEP_ID=MMETSP1096-20121128/2704_1 /TAXON_ID=156174 ORGANISM="Chrysochromulina ericina, Strain CCMP281" /NCGR_SAMPLE_ID=MMETSP1096 /ASSEMBLY_ACC=CAM_ASM_000453 /LENGTH=368 /DNA_ID=CAMNT_0023260675 /DNA_START=17 /DNA_END=1121 /DNA_ORIENTATION=+